MAVLEGSRVFEYVVRYNKLVVHMDEQAKDIETNQTPQSYHDGQCFSSASVASV